ncbi:restriction endonuclease subunit S, partial [Escherichia coli]|nr:restriction endonuclease subunit S [Escherichia coli]
SNIRPYLKKIWFANRSGICSSDVLTFETKPGFSSKFIYYNLFQDAFFEHMMKGAKGTKMPRGEKSQILEFEIPDFSLYVQEKIAEFLSSIDN